MRFGLRVVCLLALVAAAGQLWVAFSVRAQEDGVLVEGQVTNGTPDGGSVAGLTVVLHQEGAQGHQDTETVTDEAGRFRFEGVVYVPGGLYGVSVGYQGALYGQDVDLSAGSLPPITLTVYEATDSDEVFIVSAMSMLFADVDKAVQEVRVLELVTVRNTSDRTYVPSAGSMELLRFSLPTGFRDLQVDTDFPGAEVFLVDKGFALSASGPPGQYEVMYVYRVPYSGETASLTKALPYGAEMLRVLAPEGLLQLSGAGFQEPEVVSLGGRLYRLLEAAGLPRGSLVTVTVAGLSQASIVDRLGRYLSGVRPELAAPVGLGLLAVSLLVFALWRRSARARVALAGDTPPGGSAERRHLIQRLAELQAEFESGRINENAYRQRRTVLLTRMPPQPLQGEDERG